MFSITSVLEAMALWGDPGDPIDWRFDLNSDVGVSTEAVIDLVCTTGDTVVGWHFVPVWHPCEGPWNRKSA